MQQFRRLRSLIQPVYSMLGNYIYKKSQ